MHTHPQVAGMVASTSHLSEVTRAVAELDHDHGLHKRVLFSRGRLRCEHP